jgi:hypothetical protein
MKKENPNYQITIKFDNQANGILIEASQLGNWMDLGLAIEGVGVLMAIERNEMKFESAKQKGITTKEQLTDYVIEYLKKVANDFDKSYTLIPMPNLRNNE